MTSTDQPKEPEPATQNQPSDKEINFRKQEEAMKAHYEKELARIREEKDRLAKELEQNANRYDDDDDDDEPYVDKKKLAKKLAKFGQETQKNTQAEIQTHIQQALKKERQETWIKQNADFYEVLKHADKLYEHNQDLAESILEMPESFERQKLVYKNLKALGLHQDKPKEPSIQDKVDANRRSPFYQPTNVGTSPYSSKGNFSKTGQKEAYDYMQELKTRLRI